MVDRIQNSISRDFHFLSRTLRVIWRKPAYHPTRNFILLLIKRSHTRSQATVLIQRSPQIKYKKKPPLSSFGIKHVCAVFSPVSHCKRNRGKKNKNKRGGAFPFFSLSICFNYQNENKINLAERTLPDYLGHEYGSHHLCTVPVLWVYACNAEIIL